MSEHSETSVASTPECDVNTCHLWILGYFAAYEQIKKRMGWTDESIVRFGRAVIMANQIVNGGAFNPIHIVEMHTVYLKLRNGEAP